MDNSPFVALVLFATVMLRLALVLWVVWLLIPRRRRCPRCAGDELIAVASRPAALLRLRRAWCLSCGWRGVTKLARPAADLPALAPERTEP